MQWLVVNTELCWCTDRCEVCRYTYRTPHVANRVRSHTENKHTPSSSANQLFKSIVCPLTSINTINIDLLDIDEAISIMTKCFETII